MDAMDTLMLFVAVVFFCGGIVFYFLPTVIANKRRHQHVNAIFGINLFFGWTFIGWLAALVWAVTS